jgi:IS30 family transposase
MGFPTPKLKRVRIAQRKKRLIDLMRQCPDYNQEELADELGVARSTVSRDLKEINEELNLQTVEDFMIQRSRILMELEANKDLCMSKLKSLKHSPHQGARWMEEWSKIQEKVIRIYGIYSPEKMMIKHSQEFSKEQKDAAVDAALGVMKDNPAPIDITPKLIEHTEGDPDDASESEYEKSIFKLA